MKPRKNLLRWAAGTLGVVALIAVSVLVTLITLIPQTFGGAGIIIETGSMSPRINPGDVVAVRPVEFSQIQVGDIVTYAAEDALVTHRVVEVLPLVSGQPNRLITQGDANQVPDQPITEAQVRGRLEYVVPRVGLVIPFMRHYSWMFIAATGVFFLGSLAWERRQQLRAKLPGPGMSRLRYRLVLVASLFAMLGLGVGMSLARWVDMITFPGAAVIAGDLNILESEPHWGWLKDDGSFGWLDEGLGTGSYAARVEVDGHPRVDIPVFSNEWIIAAAEYQVKVDGENLTGPSPSRIPQVVFDPTKSSFEHFYIDAECVTLDESVHAFGEEGNPAEYDGIGAVWAVMPGSWDEIKDILRFNPIDFTNSSHFPFTNTSVLQNDFGIEHLADAMNVISAPIDDSLIDPDTHYASFTVLIAYNGNRHPGGPNSAWENRCWGNSFTADLAQGGMVAP